MHGVPIEVFTTNYDLVLESAIAYCEKAKIDHGRHRDEINSQTGINEMVWKDLEMYGDFHGRLTKLHGSIDWRWRDKTKKDGIVVANIGPEEDPSDHPIIWPGPEKNVLQPPFDLFHRHFERVVDKATIIIFIGFSFRDDHINQVLRSALGPGNPGKIKFVVYKKEDKETAINQEVRINSILGENVKYEKMGLNLNSVKKILTEIFK